MEESVVLAHGTFFHSSIPIADKRLRNAGAKRPEVESTVREYLMDYYAPFNERLFELLDEKMEW